MTVNPSGLFGAQHDQCDVTEDCRAAQYGPKRQGLKHCHQRPRQQQHEADRDAPRMR
jgi:hypothetical protein